MTSTEAVKNQPPTSFIGRERELSELKQRLRDPDCRLLTVVGPGGIGKTRLALRAIEDLEREFAAGVQFIPLQTATERSDLVAATADVLEVSLAGRRQSAVQLINFLQDKNMLLVLDNFEQLLPDGTELIESILVESADVKLLITSRQALNLQEEWRYPLKGLPVPEGKEEQNLLSYGALKLFRERARRLRPDFSLEENSGQVVRICQLTEGVPLALEMAASWVGALSCRAIAEEIERNLDFLATNLRNLPQRHRSMRAVFEHTWGLLSDEERHAFQRLCVFPGGFERAAAHEVAGADHELISALVDKSLLQREPDGRYQVHELLRQYGIDKLASSESEATRARELHCAYYASYLGQRLEDLHSRHQKKAIGEIGAEFENLRAAWRWAVAHGDLAALDQATTPFFLYCQLQSRYREGIRALSEAAASLEEHPASEQRDQTLARLGNHLGWLRIRIGQFEDATRDFDRSWEIYARPEFELPALMGSDPRLGLAIIASIRGEHERAAELGHEVRREAEDRQDQHNLPFAHYVLTSTEAAKGNLELARKHAERSCNLARAVDNEWFLAHPLIEGGHVERALGNYDQARKHYEASYSIKESFNDPQGMAAALNHRGEIALLQGKPSAARGLFERSRSIHQEIHDAGGLATAMQGLGQVAFAADKTVIARRHFREALEIAFDIEFTPLILSIFVEVDMLLREAQAVGLSVALLTLVKNHPASDHITAAEAERRLEQQKSELTREVFAEAEARGRDWNLEQATTALQAELTSQSDEQHEPVASGAEDQPLIEPLTARELDVLALLAEGYTNAQIADELVLALGTVKWYASEIYGKLGVTNRTQAAHRAHELQLLASNGQRDHGPHLS